MMWEAEMKLAVGDDVLRVKEAILANRWVRISGATRAISGLSTSRLPKAEPVPEICTGR